MIRSLIFFVFLCLSSDDAHSIQVDIGHSYIEEWKKFDPSKALKLGMQDAIYEFEDRSISAIDRWMLFNKQTLDKLANLELDVTIDEAIDHRLLRAQIKEERYKWEITQPHKNSLKLYSDLITRAVTDILDADFLTISERNNLLCERIRKIPILTRSAISSLKNCPKTEAVTELNRLEEAAKLYRGQLSQIPSPCSDWADSCERATKSIQNLINHVTEAPVQLTADPTPVIGRNEYARRLLLYTDSDLTPEVLESMALEEIQHVRQLMKSVSADYLKATYPNEQLPTRLEEVVGGALADMEKDVTTSGDEYLEFWLDLEDSIIDFIEKNEIATLPKTNTLRILSAPESAGPAARIGWVSNPPPFAPNPTTTLYLPSIPDSLPEQEKKDFWASFNKPFNRFIVIHEIYPGHYMQDKIVKENDHPLRLLFPYEPYIEGWGTFVERVVLDAGWQKDNKLTMLAHLRKRLENANRAYTSVMVHCHGWDQDQVMKFSTETSLLGPQFAKSLWGRLMSSPMQITSYFYGGRLLDNLHSAERKRLGASFNLKTFMDTILRAGPIPIDEFPKLYR